MRRLHLGLCWMCLGLFASCAGSKATNKDSCPIGSETCACTTGGSCDPGLECLSNICVNPNPNHGGGGSGAGNTSSTTTTTGTGGSQNCHPEGCQAIDVVFALDGSGSMMEEISALSASQAFTQITGVLAGVNCGNIQYRIGVTDDNDGGWMQVGGAPWFDSQQMTQSEIASAFAAAAAQVAAGSGTDPGCEHVLTSAKNLLVNDATGFLRPDAILVLVFVTDVDDYGAYDQLNGNSCGIGCTTPPPPLNTLYDALLALKGNDPKGLATVVVAGDPNVANGVNFCGQPGSCGCNGLDCGVFHADRLFSFAGMLTGSNGYFGNLCSGAASVPTDVQAAFANNINLACQTYIPPN
ncbi:MAG: hypothetical protein HY908_12210 [Myxococcales bacterium]|nr:hypothetical protein [Myxococcales bacterium]